MSSRPLRLAVLCSFNLDLIARPLVDALRDRGLETTLYISDYGQWETAALDPHSSLYAFDPEVVIVYADMSDLVPPWDAGLLQATPKPETGAADKAAERDQATESDKAAKSDKAAQRSEASRSGKTAPQEETLDSTTAASSPWARVQSVIAALQRHGDAPVLVHTFVASPHTALGTLEGNHPGGSYRLAADVFNRALEDYAAQHPATVVLDAARIVGREGWDRWFDARLWYLARMRLDRGILGRLAEVYARYLAALLLPRRKCLVLDLDNTLWGGIIGEDGLQGIQLGHEGIALAYRDLQQVVRALAARGVILAVASKNNPDDALSVLNEHPEMLLGVDDFAALEISWNPKPMALRRLAERLNLGLDSFVFWDDDPREREAVRTALPEVLVPEVHPDAALRPVQLLELECFDLVSLTAEDRRRGALYRQHAARNDEQASAPVDDLQSYYRSLDLKVTLHPADAVTLARVAQLSRRTNQFNFTGRRYETSQLDALLEQKDWDIYCLGAADRFGDLGIVGAAIVHRRGATCELDTLLLSCRALGRGIEAWFLAALSENAASTDKPLGGEFVVTGRNQPARACLERLGVELVPTGDPALFRYQLSRGLIQRPDWIQSTEEWKRG